MCLAAPLESGDLKAIPRGPRQVPTAPEATTHPYFWQTRRPTNVPAPIGGGGGRYWTPTHPPSHPTTLGKMPDHRQNALTSAFRADPKSPAMAYPTGGGGGRLETHPPKNPDNPPPPRTLGHTIRKTLIPTTVTP